MCFQQLLTVKGNSNQLRTNTFFVSMIPSQDQCAPQIFSKNKFHALIHQNSIRSPWTTKISSFISCTASYMHKIVELRSNSDSKLVLSTQRCKIIFVLHLGVTLIVLKHSISNTSSTDSHLVINGQTYHELLLDCQRCDPIIGPIV